MQDGEELSGIDGCLLKLTSKSDQQSSVPPPPPPLLTLNQMMKQLNFYSAPYILAPSTIASATVALAASNLFFKGIIETTSSLNSNTTSISNATVNNNKANATVAQPQQTPNNGNGECNALMTNFIQLNMSQNTASYQGLTKVIRV